MTDNTAIRVLVDMDGVIADWNGAIIASLRRAGYGADAIDLTRWDLGASDAVRRVFQRAQATPGFYRALEPIPGAIEALHELKERGREVWLCSTPDDTNPTCASDKIAWVREHLGPEWTKRLILTHDKTLVRGDVLIDDKPIITGSTSPEWVHVVFDQPYNREVDGAARLAGWTDSLVDWTLLEAMASR